MVSDIEIWRPVVGYEGFYEVSDIGRVRSLVCHNPWSWNKRKTPRLVRPVSLDNGYAHVTLCKLGHKKQALVHRIVLTAFVCPPTEGMQGAHRDGNRANNRLSNLSWLTRHENELDKHRHGTVRHGARNHLTKYDDELVRSIRERCKRGETAMALAKATGVSYCTVWRIVTGRARKFVS